MKRSSYLWFGLILGSLILTGCLTSPEPSANHQLPGSQPSVTGSSPAPPPGGGLAGGVGQTPPVSEADISEFMRIHNQARARVGAPPLAWSQELADYAQQWAERLASEGRLYHRPANSYGENIAWATSLSAGGAANMWLAERADYHGEPIGSRDGSTTGHYTQMIWRSTTRVGCGLARHGNNVYVVANYSPAGNIDGMTP